MLHRSMKSLRIGFFLTLCIFMVPSGQAQDVDSEHQLWVDITDFFDLTDSIAFGGDVGYRMSLEEDTKLLYARPTLAFRFNDSVSVRVGANIREVLDGGDRFEFRPYQDLRVRWPRISFLRFTNRFRAEERFISLPGGDLSILRLRYRIGTSLPLGKPGRSDYYVPLSFELFMNVAGDIPARIINRNRTVIGIGKRINSKWRIELNYTIQQNRRSAREEFRLTDHIWRIQIKG